MVPQDCSPVESGANLRSYGEEDAELTEGRDRATRPPRLDDVARVAGVSKATVSRYVSKTIPVAQATGLRIQKAIERLEYVPNLLAGGLATSRSRLVSIIVPLLAQSSFNETIEAIVRALRQHGYVAMLEISGTDQADLEPLIEAALARRVDAIILTGMVSDAGIRRKLRSAGTTVIETWGLPKDPIDVAVGFSHAETGRAIADFLRRRGYSNPLSITARGTRAIERRAGFLRQWKQTGGGECADLEVDGPPRFSHARAVFRLIRSSAQRPDVVICGSDGLAQGVLIEALAAGLSVPDELAVLGFGNFSIAADMRPSITTIAVDGERIGQEAAQIISARGAGELVEHQLIDVGFQLIERESA